MIHLTFGNCDGRPLCHCHRGAHQAIGDCFLALTHASVSLLDSDELCIGCRLQLDDGSEGVPLAEPSSPARQVA
jgi:hypothetical protein